MSELNCELVVIYNAVPCSDIRPATNFNRAPSPSTEAGSVEALEKIGGTGAKSETEKREIRGRSATIILTTKESKACAHLSKLVRSTTMD